MSPAGLSEEPRLRLAKAGPHSTVREGSYSTLAQKAPPTLGCKQTIDLVQRNLSKDLQVGPVEHTAEDPLQAAIVGVQQRLSGHTVGYEPHTQKEEEEEDVFHLWEGKDVSSCLGGSPPTRGQGPRLELTIRSTMMILGPSCLWMAKMWMSRSVNTMKSMASTVRPASNTEGSILEEDTGWTGLLVS